MFLSPVRSYLIPVFVLLLWSAPVHPVKPDQNLLRLVPPDTQLLAGINPAPPGNRHNRFVLITHENLKDMDDFKSLSGGDTTRHISQVMFAAKAGAPGKSGEHSLFVSGHFDRERIYRSAIDEGGTSKHYRGFSLVEIKPFSRDQSGMDEVRWLAVLDSSVLVLGTVAMVMEELDQRLTPAAPDPRLMQMLEALRRDDDAWSIILGGNSSRVRESLMALNPDLAKLADGRVLRLGIRYGHSIEFEYAVDPSSESPEMEPDSRSGASPVAPTAAFSLLGSLQLQSNSDGGAHGTVKVSQERYDRWLGELWRRNHQIGSSSH